MRNTIIVVVVLSIVVLLGVLNSSTPEFDRSNFNQMVEFHQKQIDSLKALPSLEGKIITYNQIPCKGDCSNDLILSNMMKLKRALIRASRK